MEGKISHASSKLSKDVWGSGAIAPLFLTSALDVCEWSAQFL
jgi:hypothetical protein